MSRTWSFAIGLALVFLALQLVAVDGGVCSLPILLAAGLFVLWRMSRSRPGVNALGVYLLLLGSTTLLFATAMVLTLIGPIATLLLTVGLGGVTIYLTVTRGEGVKRRRELMGLCRECGYDLRATDDRCPECGEPLSVEIVRRRRIIAELKAARRDEPNRPSAIEADPSAPKPLPPPESPSN